MLSGTSGDDVIVTVGDGKISLIDAASLLAVNIKFKKTFTATNSWRLNGSTATYGTASNTLITVTGVKSLAGLSLSGKVVTVAASSLNKSTVSIIGSSYTLALANDVTKSSSTSKSWSYKNSVATYKQTRSAGYSLASNSKSITYSKGTTSTLATVSGSGYEFKFAASNSSIIGSTSADKITSRASKVSISGGKGNDQISLISGANNNVIIYKSSDGNDLIVDWGLSDSLSIASGNLSGEIKTSGDTAILTVNNAKISIQDGVGKTFNYWYDGELHRTILIANANNILEDDNYAVAPLSALVQTKSADYSVAEMTSTKDNFFPTLTSTKK